jgi:hypothetical protein
MDSTAGGEGEGVLVVGCFGRRVVVSGLEDGSSVGSHRSVLVGRERDAGLHVVTVAL